MHGHERVMRAPFFPPEEADMRAKPSCRVRTPLRCRERFLPRGELLEDRVPPGTLLSLLAGPWPNLDLSPAEMIPLPEWSEPSWVNPLDQVPAGGTAGTSSAPAP